MPGFAGILQDLGKMGKIGEKLTGIEINGQKSKKMDKHK